MRNKAIWVMVFFYFFFQERLLPASMLQPMVF